MTFPAGATPLIVRAAQRARGSKADRALFDELRERCEGEEVKGGVAGRHGETGFRLSVLPKQQGYVVSVPCPLAGRSRVTRKGALDRWMEGFVPAVPFRSRETRFDREFNVQTRDMELTAAILTRPTNRAEVRRLFEHGVRDVHLDGERGQVTCPRKALGREPTAEQVLELVEPLARIADAVRAFAAHHEVRPSPKHDPVVVAAWSALGLSGVAGFAMLIGGSVEFPLARPARFLPLAALLGLPAVAPAVLLLALAVQRRTAPFGLVRGLSAVALLVVPLFVSGGLLLANGVLDRSAPVERIVTIVGKKVRRNDGGNTHHAGLASWWTEGDVRWVRVPRATYERIEPRVSRMRIRTHAGRLGHEWLGDGHRLADGE